MQLKEAIKKRRSIRRYMTKKPDWRKIINAIDMARYAPRAGNQPCLSFILVKDEQKIHKLAEASQQDFVKQASYAVVVVSDDDKLKRSYEERAEKFSRQQAGAAIENFLLSLTEQGLATCWIGWFEEEQVKRLLDIPDNLTVEAFFPIGKETNIPTSEKAKQDLDSVLFFDKWKNKYMKPMTRLKFESS